MLTLLYLCVVSNGSYRTKHSTVTIIGPSSY